MGSKYRYEIIISWSEEDQAFIAEVELSGCAADSASYLETLANLERVIDQWIERPGNWDVPYLNLKVG